MFAHRLTAAKLSFSCLLLLGWSIGRGQESWINVDSNYAILPASIHVYKSVAPLDGRPNIAYYLTADLHDKHLWFRALEGNGKRITPAEFYEREGKPAVVLNGSFFSYATNKSLCLVMNEGRMERYNALVHYDSAAGEWYYTTRGAIGISRKREAEVGWIFTDSGRRWPYALLQGPSLAKGRRDHPHIGDLRWEDLTGVRRGYKRWKMQTAIGGGPVLIKDGKILITNKQEYLFIRDSAVKHPRTAMGYMRDGRLVVLMIQGRSRDAEGADLKQEARMLLDIGCYEAVNLDGGGSSCMLVNGKETIWPSDKGKERPVPSVFMINAF
jgi:hypothetical protein